MSNLLLIPVCILSGILLKKIKSVPRSAHKSINSLIIYVTLPALTLYYIPQIQFSRQVLYPAAFIWIAFLISVVFFVTLQRLFRWDRRTTGSLILTCGLANTAFVGFPVLLALFGEEGLKIGVIMDQAGSFLVLSTLGIITASVFSGNTWSLKRIAIDIITYPSFIAFAISIIMVASGIRHNEISSAVLNKIGSPTIILALISVGMQLDIKIDKTLWKELVTGLAYKLIIAPLIILFAASYLLKLSGIVFAVSIIETAMPPMIMGSVLAVKFDLNPKLANLVVGIGIPVSAITLAFWYWLIK